MDKTKSTDTAQFPIGHPSHGPNIRVSRRLFLRASASLAILAVLDKSVEAGRVYASAPHRTYGSAPYGRISYFKFSNLLFLPAVTK